MRAFNNGWPANRARAPSAFPGVSRDHGGREQGRLEIKDAGRFDKDILARHALHAHLLRRRASAVTLVVDLDLDIAAAVEP